MCATVGLTLCRSATPDKRFGVADAKVCLLAIRPSGLFAMLPKNAALGRSFFFSIFLFSQTPSNLPKVTKTVCLLCRAYYSVNTMRALCSLSADDPFPGSWFIRARFMFRQIFRTTKANKNFRIRLVEFWYADALVTHRPVQSPNRSCYNQTDLPLSYSQTIWADSLALISMSCSWP